MQGASGSFPDILAIRVAAGVLATTQPWGPGDPTPEASGPFPDYGCYSSTSQLLAAFGAGPARMRAAVEGLSESELRARPRGEEKWSIHEIIMHTTDSEIQGTLRVRKILAEPSSVLPSFNQDLWASGLNYREQSDAARERALSLLALLRQQNLPLLEQATPEDWARSGIHPSFGVVTLRNMLELYAGHMERHIGQILDSRAQLGRPLKMEAMLSRRL
jgi:hypothetical protein